MPESPSGVSSSHGNGGQGPSRHSRPGSDAPDPAAVAPPASDIELPATFGKYFLTEKLATGGMAEIYLAKIVGPGGFEKQLVIKQIHPRLSGQRHFVDLFVAEAKTLVTLAHGNIVPVYELGVLDDTYFIAMEYIDGPTLYRLTETLRRRSVPMQPAIAAWITARILEGLDYAHRKGDGVIHRDLSPRNVMLSRDGEVKLVDFGIAVTLGNPADDSGGSEPTGSFPYMSPEQVRKQPLTVQTDLFSVGVLFWEMLVGRRLFARGDPGATLAAVVGSAIARPSQVAAATAASSVPAVPVKLDDVVMRALERDLAARWPSAGDMLAALQRYLYSLDEPPGPRDVAALVARYCPPETRRLPTHHDLLGEPEWPSSATSPRRAGTAPAGDAEPARPGPHTAVIPRDGAARGKRVTRARTETFATHVALEELLERASPAAAAIAGAERDPAVDAITQPTAPRAAPAAGHASAQAAGATVAVASAPATAPVTRSTTARAAAAAIHDGDPAAGAPRHRPGSAPASEPTAQPVASPLAQLPGHQPPSRSLLVVAGIGALAMGAAAIYVFYQGRGAVERPGISVGGEVAGKLPYVDTSLPSGDQPAGAAGSTREAHAGSAAPTAQPGAATEHPGTAATRPGTAADDLRPPSAPPPVVDTQPGTAASSATASDTASPSDTRPGAAESRPGAPRQPGNRPLRPEGRPAIEPARIPASPVRAAGTARLKIGANPWGTVLLDGKSIGRTPIEHLAVPAGRHTIEVIFAGEDPPRSQKFTVDLADGDTRDVLADFTRSDR